MGERLGRVKADPLVHELGDVPGRKRFDSDHGSATLRTTAVILVVRIMPIGNAIDEMVARTSRTWNHPSWWNLLVVLP